MGILSLVLGPVVKAVEGFFTRSHQLKMARHEAQVKWATTMADASKTSWKDEWWVLLFSMPIIMLMAGYPGPMLVLKDIFGMDTLRIIYMTMIGASFGVNLHDRVKLNKLKRVILENGKKTPHIENDPENTQEDE
ncbi:MAG: hypothetical protein V3V32_05355 [Dehalococcoidia bacterium]